MKFSTKLSVGSQLTVQLDPLDQFLVDVKKSAKDLAWIRNAADVRLVFDPVDDRIRRSPDDMNHIFANFNTIHFFDEEADETESGDAWYNSFRSMECGNGNCVGSKVNVRKPRRGKKKKKKWRFRTKNSQYKGRDYVDEMPFLPARLNTPQLNYQNPSIRSVDQIPNLQKTLFFDQHNFHPDKVSVDQKNSPNILELKDQLEHTKNDLSHEADYKLSKIEQDTMGKRSNISWPLRHAERELSLISPSNRLRPLADLKLENRISEESRNVRSLDPISEIKLKISNRMINKGMGASLPSDALDHRKTISIDEILSQGHTEDKDDSWKQNRFEPEEVYRSGRKILQFDEDYALLETKVAVQLPKNTTKSPPTPGRPSNFKKPASHDKSSQMTKNETQTVKLKFDLAINATLPANCTGLKDSQLNVNTTRKLKGKRAIIFPQISLGSTRQTNEDVRESLLKTYENSPATRPLDDLITGKLPSRVINAVFMLARNNAQFRNQIWPGLKKQKDIATDAVSHDLSLFQNEDNAAQIQHTEDMLHEVMENLNNIIEQQIHSRSCIPLRPDLQAFYDQIVASRLENERIRARSHSKDQINHIVKRETVTKSEIREKSNVVKKLLDQYDYLSVGDQAKAKEVKDLLEMHEAYLKDLEQNETQQKRMDDASTNEAEDCDEGKDDPDNVSN